MRRNDFQLKAGTEYMDDKELKIDIENGPSPGSKYGLNRILNIKFNLGTLIDYLEDDDIYELVNALIEYGIIKEYLIEIFKNNNYSNEVRELENYLIERFEDIKGSYKENVFRQKSDIYFKICMSIEKLLKEIYQDTLNFSTHYDNENDRIYVCKRGENKEFLESINIISKDIIPKNATSFDSFIDSLRGRISRAWECEKRYGDLYNENEKLKQQIKDLQGIIKFTNQLSEEGD